MTTYDSDKAEQVDRRDHKVTDLEFESNRPHGESRLYRYLMDFSLLGWRANSMPEPQQDHQHLRPARRQAKCGLVVPPA
jgi:hypothetical protein